VQAQTRVPGVAAYLDPAMTQPAWQLPGAIDPATSLSLPTSAEVVRIGGTTTKFRRSFYVGTCWRSVAGGDCVVVPLVQQTTSIPMFRVIVAITWPSTDCSGGTCSYVAAMLLGADTTDPTFGL
jgi:hypothetical protein